MPTYTNLRTLRSDFELKSLICLILIIVPSRIGHLDRLTRIYAYIHKFENFKIRFRVEEPDLSYLDNSIQQDWSQSVYGEHVEDLPDDMPIPLGKKVTLTHWFDANLMHDVL